MPEFCSNCKAQVPDGAKVCPDCGVEFEGEVQGKLQTFCEKCGNEIQEDAAFCANCGAVFNQYGTLTKNKESSGAKGRIPSIVIGASLSYLAYGAILAIVSASAVFWDLGVPEGERHFLWGLGILLGAISLAPSALYVIFGLMMLSRSSVSKVGAALGAIVSIASFLLILAGIPTDMFILFVEPFGAAWLAFIILLAGLRIGLSAASWSQLGKRT